MGLRVEIQLRLTIVVASLLILLGVPNLMFLAVFASFFLICIREIPDSIELLHMLDSRLITVTDSSAPACLVGVLSLLLASSGIAGSWCACKT